MAAEYGKLYGTGKPSGTRGMLEGLTAGKGAAERAAKAKEDLGTEQAAKRKAALKGKIKTETFRIATSPPGEGPSKQVSSALAMMVKK